jgi:hypothetical protein
MLPLRMKLWAVDAATSVEDVDVGGMCENTMDPLEKGREKL